MGGVTGKSMSRKEATDFYHHPTNPDDYNVSNGLRPKVPLFIFTPIGISIYNGYGFKEESIHYYDKFKK